MFKTIHLRGEIKEGGWKERMRVYRENIVRRMPWTVPERKEARLIGKCIREWWEEYFRFIEAGMGATNNLAELMIRQSILDRIVTPGSRR
jgi:hypothetical protein